MPYFMMESAYENEHNAIQQRLRSEAYWPLLCGGMGYIFGNCPIWHFGSDSSWCGITDWKTQMNYPGSLSMKYVQQLFRSRPWFLLIPDFDHSVITEGFGEWGRENYVTTALTSDGTTLIAYLPVWQKVTVDMMKINGKIARCWWYNPDTGSATDNGTFSTRGMHQFEPPSDGDWILVIDDASRDFSTPGTKIIY